MVGAYAVGRIAESMEKLSFKRLLAGSILNLFYRIWSWYDLSILHYELVFR